MIKQNYDDLREDLIIIETAHEHLDRSFFLTCLLEFAFDIANDITDTSMEAEALLNTIVRANVADWVDKP